MVFLVQCKRVSEEGVMEVLHYSHFSKLSIPSVLYVVPTIAH